MESVARQARRLDMRSLSWSVRRKRLPPLRIGLALGLLVALIGPATASASPTHVSFGSVTTYPSKGPFPFTLAIGDLNKDGNPDLVVVNSGFPSSVSVLLGDGQGGF